MVLSDCLIDLNRQTGTPNMYVGTIFNVPESTYSLKITYQKCDGAQITDNYATMEIRKGGSLIAAHDFHPGGDAVVFDNNNLCVALSWFDCQATDQAQWWTAYRVWYNADPCVNVSCPDQCYGSDLWSTKCDPATGLCVQDVNKGSSPICSATHYLDLKLHPHPWYTPQQAADKAILLSVEINGAIMNWMTFLTGWTYLGTTIAADGTTVLIRIYLREESSAAAAAPSMHIQSLGGPITAGQIALAVVAIGVINVAVGIIFSAIFGPKGAGQDVGLTNGNLTDAGESFIKDALAGCETVTCSDPSLTQDQKAACIKNCYDDLLTKWKEYQEDLFPDADHTPLGNTITEIQKCYDTYNGSAKTTADYDTFTACLQIKSNEGIDKDNGNITIIYPPDAPAGSKTVPGTEDCWIPGLAGGCILSAKTGKTIAIISGIVIGGFLIFSLIKK